MGRKSRADLISELKTAGAKGSLSKMNRTKLTEMHAQMIPGGGSAGQLPSVAPIAGSVKTEVVAETGSGQRPSTAPSRLRIDPNEDDISDYLEGGGFWKSLAGDVTNAAKEFQHSEIGKDVELAGVDVGEVGAIAVGDTALMASSVIDGPAGAVASAGLDVAASEGADALREKIRDS